MDQRLMEINAHTQARERAKREGKPMNVFVDADKRWYVRSDEEGEPDAIYKPRPRGTHVPGKAYEIEFYCMPYYDSIEKVVKREWRRKRPTHSDKPYRYETRYEADRMLRMTCPGADINEARVVEVDDE